jgi:[protein-PII] uridylyltransferase
MSSAVGRPSPGDQLAGARRDFVTEAERGRAGLATHAAFTDRMDALVQGIVSEAGERCRCAPFAVAATGGFGRRALCLHSDLDLLIVFEAHPGPDEERFVKAVLLPLWDLRLRVGHQVLRERDVRGLARTDQEFLLALRDTRLLAGDPALLVRAVEPVSAPGTAFETQTVDALLQLTRERHASFNDTIYQLEPDVKDSPGGLRDLVAADVLRSLAAGVPVERLRAPRGLLDAAEFLMRVRAVLHLEAGRNANVLGHDAQERVADRLRFHGVAPRQRVEALMSAYFRHARVVSRELERACRLSAPLRQRHALAPPRRRGARKALPVLVGRNLEVTADGVSTADEASFVASPASWLRAFEVALERGTRVSDRTLALVEEHASRCTVRDLLPAPEDRRRLLRLLRPRRGLYAALAAMHECGLLARLFPEFHLISCRVTRDFYHKYTVDEHTLLAIRGLERLIGDGRGPRARFGSILGELHAPEHLVLALLFHDVGKWKDGDHAAESVRLAQTMLDRLELEPEARREVEFLIGHHLDMSQVAFRRDTEDPAVVRRFASLVGTEERLKALCLMTLVDLESVSADVLTPWREELLWRLYVDAYNHLTLGYSDDTIGSGQSGLAALLASRPAGLSAGDLTGFLEGFPQRYLARFDADDVYRHARLACDLQPDELHIVLEQKAEAWVLTLVAHDKPYLFSSVCGVLSYFGMDIMRGSAMTSTSGRVLDVFEFADREGFFRLNPGGPSRFETLLRDAVAGRQDVSALLARRERGAHARGASRRIRPVVHVDGEHSQRYTVLEIVAQDAPGLLHHVSRTISRHGCNVELVLISTEGHKAIDVFHVTRGKAKLSDGEQARLKQELEHVLEEGHEAHPGDSPSQQGGRDQGLAR